MRPLLAVLACLLAVPAAAAERTGTVYFEDVRADRTLRQTESAILRRPVGEARGFTARTALHVFVADGRDAWDRDVAPRITEAVSAGPAAVAALDGAGVAHAGPAIDGAAVEFQLPDGRGRGFVAVHLPLLLDRGKADPKLLDSTRPDKGLYVAGVAVDRGDGGGVSAVYVPGRPKGMARGGPPDVRPKPVPSGGRGDLVIFRGKGGSGRDGERLRGDLEGLFGRSKLTPSELRTFPKGDDGLDRDLKTFRVEATTLEASDGWYRALASGPDRWTERATRLAHPVRYLTFTAPVVVADGDGNQRAMILGGVALYAPLVMKAFQAPLYLGVDGPSFFAAVHRGEVPFVRDGDDVYFHRAALDRWKAGDGRDAGGKDYGRKGLERRLESLGEQSKGVRRAKPTAMPKRFTEAPDDAPNPMRGRVYEVALAAWLGHYDRRGDFGAAPAFALTDVQGGVRFRAGFGGRSSGGGGGDPVLQITDAYALDGSCTPGESVVAAVGFVVDNVPDGEEATLDLSWSLSAGSALVRLGTQVVREAGEHEIYVQAGCPSGSGSATFEAVLTWEATGMSDTKTAKVKIK